MLSYKQVLAHDVTHEIYAQLLNKPFILIMELVFVQKVRIYRVFTPDVGHRLKRISAH